MVSTPSQHQPSTNAQPAPQSTLKLPETRSSSPPRCPPLGAFTAWCEAKKVDEILHQVMQERAGEMRAALQMGKRASPKELLQQNFGLVRNAIELLLTQSDSSSASKIEAESAEIVFKCSAAHHIAAAINQGLRHGLPPAVAGAVGQLNEPHLPAGARVFWSLLSRWHGEVEGELYGDAVDLHVLEEVVAALELPVAAAPALVR